MAPSNDPAVLPTGIKGTAGKTAKTQNTPKAIEPKTTFTVEAIAMIYKLHQHKLILRLEEPP